MTIPYHQDTSGKDDKQETADDYVRPEQDLPEQPKLSTAEDAVVFVSPCQYSLAALVLLAIAPVVLIVSIIVVNNDKDSSDDDKKAGIIAITIALVAILIVYVLVIPRRFDVRSNGSVGITPLLCLTYKFKDIDRAYELETGLCEGATRPRIKFAMSLHSRVQVQRKHGKWDVLVSPQDAKGFVEAVNNVARRLEYGPGYEERESFVFVEKPPLSTSPGGSN